MNEVINLPGLSNRQFLERFAKCGRVGLAGGITLIDRTIARAQRHLDTDKRWSPWTHSFIFQGQRPDGHHWVIESDLQIARKHIHLGVQENRIEKYFDEELYTTLAVLDFDIETEKEMILLREGLELVASRVRYSLRELVGTWIALRHGELREQENLLARNSSFYCSAFVQHLFRKAGIDLAPGLDAKNTTPEDISRTPVPHTTYLLQRAVATSKVKELASRVRRRVKAKIKKTE